MHEDAEEDIYANNRASCHGDDLSRGAGPDLTAVGEELSEEEMEDIIENGKGSMPGGFIENEKAIQKLANWLSDKRK